MEETRRGFMKIKDTSHNYNNMGRSGLYNLMIRKCVLHQRQGKKLEILLNFVLAHNYLY